MAETRWLDREEQRTWRTFMLATRLLFARLGQELEREASMPVMYYQVLVSLSEAPGWRLRMSELAKRSVSSRSCLSHAVTRLEADGWVMRESCSSDRRGAFAVMTDAGFAALEAAAPFHVESVRTHLFDQVEPPQLDALRAISEQILRHLVATNGAPADELGLLSDLGEGYSPPALASERS